MTCIDDDLLVSQVCVCDAEGPHSLFGLQSPVKGQSLGCFFVVFFCLFFFSRPFEQQVSQDSKSEDRSSPSVWKRLQERENNSFIKIFNIFILTAAKPNKPVHFNLHPLTIICIFGHLHPTVNQSTLKFLACKSTQICLTLISLMNGDLKPQFSLFGNKMTKSCVNIIQGLRTVFFHKAPVRSTGQTLLYSTTSGQKDPHCTFNAAKHPMT